MAGMRPSKYLMQKAKACKRQQAAAKWRRTATSFLLAGLGGFGGALLLAPKSGRETREQITEAVIDGSLAVQVGSIRAVHRGRRTVSNLLANTKTVVADVSSAASSVKQSVSEIQELRQVMQRHLRQVTRKPADTTASNRHFQEAAERFRAEAEALTDSLS